MYELPATCAAFGALRSYWSKLAIDPGVYNLRHNNSATKVADALVGAGLVHGQHWRSARTPLQLERLLGSNGFSRREIAAERIAVGSEA